MLGNGEGAAYFVARWTLGEETAGHGAATAIAPALKRSDLGCSMITDYLFAYRNWLLRN
jgi:hypothetical protein